MEKPTLEQIKWVLTKLWEHVENHGSYRTLIYTKMGLKKDAYAFLLTPGLHLSNLFNDIDIKKCNWFYDDFHYCFDTECGACFTAPEVEPEEFENVETLNYCENCGRKINIILDKEDKNE